MTDRPSLRGTTKSQPKGFTCLDLILLALLAPIAAAALVILQNETDTSKPAAPTPARQPLICPAEGCLT